MAKSKKSLLFNLFPRRKKADEQIPKESLIQFQEGEEIQIRKSVTFDFTDDAKSDSRLLNCPFCGGNPIEVHSISTVEEVSYIECRTCKSRTKGIPLSTIQDEMHVIVELWNKRIIDSDIFKENIQLKQLIAESNLRCIYCDLPKNGIGLCSFGANCLRSEDLKGK